MGENKQIHFRSLLSPLPFHHKLKAQFKASSVFRLETFDQVPISILTIAVEWDTQIQPTNIKNCNYYKKYFAVDLKLRLDFFQAQLLSIEFKLLLTTSMSCFKCQQLFELYNIKSFAKLCINNFHILRVSSSPV